MQSNGVPVYIHGVVNHLKIYPNFCSPQDNAHWNVYLCLFILNSKYSVVPYIVMITTTDSWTIFITNSFQPPDELKSFYHRLRHFFNIKVNRNYFDTVECNKAICDQFEWDEWKENTVFGPGSVCLLLWYLFEHCRGKVGSLLLPGCSLTMSML